MYGCIQCFHESQHPLERCPQCQGWYTYRPADGSLDHLLSPPPPPNPASPRSYFPHHKPENPLISVTEINSEVATRLVLGGDLADVDRVLGGGIVRGSAMLLAGAPGSGKSTCGLQVGHNYAAQGRKVIYLSGEESREQTRLRAGRIGCLHPGLLVMSEIEMGRGLELLAAHDLDLLIIDSIQSVYCADTPGSAGSTGQVKESSARIIQSCKRRNISVILIGHVTKDNSIAGPRMLEHMVDTVLYLEGDKETSNYRILRAQKNRFGAIQEAAVFRMEGEGLRVVADPTLAFLPEGEPSPGSVLTVILEGTKALLVEIQALVSASKGTGKRRVVGIDVDRLALIEAVLANAGAPLGKRDLFLTVSGGISIAHKPEADLAILLAILSSLRNRNPAPERIVAYGEIALNGRVRQAPGHDIRKEVGVRYGYALLWSASPDSQVVIQTVERALEVIHA